MMKRTRTQIALIMLVLLWSASSFAQDAPATTPDAPAPTPDAPAATPDAPATTPEDAAPADAAVPADAAAAPGEEAPMDPAMAEPEAPMAEPEMAPAEEAAASDSMSSQPSSRRDVSFTIAPHIGALVPQAFNELGSWPVFGLEFGYIAPFDVGNMHNPLQVTMDIMFTQPGASGTEESAVLGEMGATFDWELTQRMLVLDVTGLWRFLDPADGIGAYAEFGPRFYFMDSIMKAEGNGDDFGENSETKTEYGLMVAGGVEYMLGPGALYGALEFGWSDLNTRITGDANTGAFLVDMGYRVMF